MNIFVFNEDALYEALIDKDRSYDGHVFVCVKTTGIFCRLSCSARKPKRENVFFCDSISACLEQGYRTCKICRPLEMGQHIDPIYSDLMARLDLDPAYVWSEDDIVALKLDPSTVRRVFKRQIGMTFLELARLRRVGLGLAALSTGAPVIEAQLEAGFESGSGFREAIQRLLNNPPDALKGRRLLKATWIETPIGQMIAICDQHALHLLEFFDRKGLPNELKKLQAATRSSIDFGRSPIMNKLEQELQAYYQGTACQFETPLAYSCTGFAPLVWDMLRKIPPSVVCSYSDLANKMHKPTAMRAVARANGQNQISIIIPCHRVIGANGALTGYGGGLWRKEWLLKHEKRYFT